MKCEFKNCKEPAFTCGNVICYTQDGDYETICLCKKHCLMFVPKKLRDYIESKEHPHFLESKIPPEKQIERLQQMIDIIKSHTPTPDSKYHINGGQASEILREDKNRED